MWKRRRPTIIRRKRKSRFHKGTYRGMQLDSSYELAYVLYCQDHGIQIIRNTCKFPYIYRKKRYNYIPDFIVDGKYVETKGRETARTFAKYKYFPHPLTILRKDDLKPVFAYVVAKYGKNFVRLYDKV